MTQKCRYSTEFPAFHGSANGSLTPELGGETTLQLTWEDLPRQNLPATLSIDIGYDAACLGQCEWGLIFNRLDWLTVKKHGINAIISVQKGFFLTSVDLFWTKQRIRIFSIS